MSDPTSTRSITKKRRRGKIKDDDEDDHPRQKRKAGINGPASSAVYDLMVLLPKECPTVHTQELRDRLRSTGFTHMALTHTIYGYPKPQVDLVDNALQSSLWQSQTPRKITVLRRLHAVLENLSDVGHYARRTQTVEEAAAAAFGHNSATNVNARVADQTALLLLDYDLVSIAPRNDATFQSACASATAADIITLDYTTGGRLPFKIRSADVKAVVARKAVFEIPYAPAILNPKLRKGLVQTCRLLQLASVGVGKHQPQVLLSSGSRKIDNSNLDDVGVMALRTPGDLMNLAEVVMHFDQRASFDALHSAGTAALQHARQRKFGTVEVEDNHVATGGMVVRGFTIVEYGSATTKIDGMDKMLDVASVEQGQNSKSQAVNDNTRPAESPKRNNANTDSSHSHSEEEDHQDGFIAI